ncbi:hypothetical protein WA026_019863 [Henosepilachna vigintioctopunctata]
MSLHVGDKILEINGTPVKDTPLDNVENLLRYSDSVLQLTIEHDPDTVSKKYLKSRILPNNPLTTTASETNIPDKKSNIPVDTRSLGSSDSISEDCSTKVQQGRCTLTPEFNISLNQKEESKERLFKRRDEGYMSGTRSRQLKRKSNSSDKQSLDKERSSSLSRLLDDTPNSKRCLELSRAYSFLEPKPQQRVFRASDLVKGELLGQGFFGQVFKVTTRDTEEVMVLKELYRVDEEAQKNFLKEVAVLRNLSHNNVLRFIGVLYKERRLHLVTEYISGGTLTELIHDVTQPLPWEQRVSFAKDIAAGMAYLHSMNIIHRDLNSHNCLVRDDKTVIVADFGLARILSHNTESVSRRLSPKGTPCSRRQERKKRYTVVGNPYWMAPEMMKGNKYDEKVDIFSFGIILCEIIGRVQADPDFLPRSNDFGLNQITFKEKFCGSCPEPFYKIAFLCTDLNPDKRPPFEVMEVWLESLLMHLSVGMPLPPDLVFDICHFRGISPNSSGSTTPEGIPSGHRSPALEPICEGRMIDTTSTKNFTDKSNEISENLKSITKGSSTENLFKKEISFVKPIIKVSSIDALDGKHDNYFHDNEFRTKSCENIISPKNYSESNGPQKTSAENCLYTKTNENFNKNISEFSISDKDCDLNSRDFPNYENINFLKNDKNFIDKNEKSVGVQKIPRQELHTEDKFRDEEITVKKISSNMDNFQNFKKENAFKIQLRKVPKTFTRNKFTSNNCPSSFQSPENEKVKFFVKGGSEATNNKRSNLSIQNIKPKTNMNSRATEKDVNSADKPLTSVNRKLVRDIHSSAKEDLDPINCSVDIPDVVSSTLMKSTSDFSNRNDGEVPAISVQYDFRKSSVPANSVVGTFSINQGILRNEFVEKSKGLSCKDMCSGIDKEQKGSTCDIDQPSCSLGSRSSLVKSIVDSLNRKDRGSVNLGNRLGYGRSSLKVSPKEKHSFENANKYTAL